MIVKIRHLYFAEHWKIGTIASELGLHHATVPGALNLTVSIFKRARQERPKQLIDPYLEFVQQTLKSYRRLRATRIFQMIRLRGYKGSASQLRRVVQTLRPAAQKEAFLQLRTFPGE